MNILTEEKLKELQKGNALKVVPGQSPSQSEQTLDVEKLIKEGRIEEETEPIPGYKIKMHTLSVGDYESINSSGISTGLTVSTEEKKADFKTIVIILSRAISELNGRKFITENEKMELAVILGNCQPSTIGKLMEVWSVMQEKQTSLYSNEEVKKNS